MPLSDSKLWACAQHVITGFGDQARDHAFDRIVDCASKGSEDGIATWQAIAERIEKLIAVPSANDVRH